MDLNTEDYKTILNYYKLELPTTKNALKKKSRGNFSKKIM